MKKFSQRLSALRHERGLTQAECASLNNLHRSTYNGYESEYKEPNYETLCRLAAFFGVTVDYLLGASDFRTTANPRLVSDSEKFASVYDRASEPAQESANAALDAVYNILAQELASDNLDHLTLYARLFAVVDKLRVPIRRSAAAGNISDPLSLSALMSGQSTLKNDVCAVLDELLQADLGVSAHKSSRTPYSGTAM